MNIEQMSGADPKNAELQNLSAELRAESPEVRRKSFMQQIDKIYQALTPEQMKLLYLIHRYSHCAQSKSEKEEWIRRLPLLVLIYELTVDGTFDYDYAPMSDMVGTRRIFINISQEGADDIDDLREAELINGLKLSASDCHSITAYQVSNKGLAILEKVPDKYKKEVESKISIEGRLVYVDFDGEKFFLKTKEGYSKESTITDIEDVSYVSSPFLPECLRYGSTKKLTNNAHRSHVSEAGSTNIRDDFLNEIIFLGDVKLLIGEWIPFGTNHIVALNEKLGSTERVQGGLFTAMIDQDPEETKFSMQPGATAVSILEFDQTEFLNFEAEVHFPEEEGILQVETFGVHVRDDGTICYGLMMDAIMNRKKDHVSLDHLARVLADIHKDSSAIMETLVTAYQHSLLAIVLTEEDLSNREKFNVIICKQITPRLPADKYMDKEDFENELKQVLNITHTAHNIDDDIIIFGKNGLLLVTDDESIYYEVLVLYQSLMGRRIFLDAFFYRTFALYETLKHTRQLIDTYESNPTSLSTIRALLSETSKKSILLQELLSYLQESLETIDIQSVIDKKESERRDKLLHLLNIPKLFGDLSKRVKDLKKNMDGVAHELEALREMTDVISESLFFRLQEAMQSNTKNLENVIRSNERSSSSLEILQLVLSGTLAFEILDRLTGEWSVLDTWWGKTYLLEPLIQKPGIWFFLNLLLWFAVAFGLKTFMEHLTASSSSVLVVRFKANMPIDMDALRRYLATKPIGEEELSIDNKLTIKKVNWIEPDINKWDGNPTTIEITFDEVHGYLLSVFLQIDKKGKKKITQEAAKSKFMYDINQFKVIRKLPKHELQII